MQIRSQQQRQRGWKLYSFHTPEVQRIGKGKAAAHFEFGVKASSSPTNRTVAHPQVQCSFTLNGYRGTMIGLRHAG